MSANQILIIDDEPLQHIILEEHLQASGYRVLHATDGENGLEMMEIHKPDLILLDIQMPVMDGFQTLDAIRKKDNFRDIPVLYLTSQEDPPQKVKGLELGADDYIIKPFHKEELLARIKAVLRRVERYCRPDRAMEGNLSTIELSDLLKSMEIGAKTATISMEAIDAKIFIENGSLVNVRQGFFTGNEALTRIFLLQKGTFSVHFEPLPSDIPKAPAALRTVLFSVLANMELGSEDYITKSPRRRESIDRIKETLRHTISDMRTEGTMEGDLSNISLSDLLQNMEQGSKTASITLESIDGEIFIKGGSLILARQGNFTGDAALFRIFLLEKGTFSVRFNELPEQISGSPRSLMSILMGAIAKVDEIRETLSRFGVENILIKVSSEVSEFPELEKFKNFSDITFVELLTLMEGDLTDNLSVLIKAAKKGKLKKLK